MSTQKTPDYSLVDLGMAYRKAKADWYYSGHAFFEDLADYEENLTENLTRLLEKLNSNSDDWIEAPEFLGDWYPIPAGIRFPDAEDQASQKQKAVYSSPKAQWKTLSKQNPEAQFRVMAHNSVDFHVLSALWIARIGSLFDEKLEDCSYGNRVRRLTDNRYSELSQGSFKHYFTPYRTWRDNGLKSIRESLESGRDLVVMSADVSGFYHNIDTRFMLNEAFLSDCGIALSDIDARLHRLFIQALEKWAANTPLGKGLPVGLPASAIVANMALWELDRSITGNLTTVYFGRYVDDILLAFENVKGFTEVSEVNNWLASEITHLDHITGNKDKKGALVFAPPYLDNSLIEFSNIKNKTFFLDHLTGMGILNSIERHIQERASEWRSLPDLPESPLDVTTTLMQALNADGDGADSLRKTDSLSTRRAAFAIMLRDFEAYEKDLPAEQWTDLREAFFDTYCQQILTPVYFFDMAMYLPRVIQLATACEDFVALRHILKGLDQLFETISNSCKICIKAVENDKPANTVSRWRNHMVQLCRRYIVCAFPYHLSEKGEHTWRERFSDEDFFKEHLTSFTEWTSGWDLGEMRREHHRFFVTDLAYLPLRYTGLPQELYRKQSIPGKDELPGLKKWKSLLTRKASEGYSLLASTIDIGITKGMPSGLIFSTRPYTAQELYLIDQDLFEPGEQSRLNSILLSIRGYEVDNNRPFLDNSNVLQIDTGGEPTPSISIGLASWKTIEESWIAAVTKNPDPDPSRYRRLMLLVKQALECGCKMQYLVFPECSIPAHWFLRLTRKLVGRGISLIAGIEYLHTDKLIVTNQVWASLTHSSMEKIPSSIVYRQEKQRPAIKERKDLDQLAGLTLAPKIPWEPKENPVPPIIRHGDFYFAMLVCSELTNISYKCHLKGKVDALIVPEWNQDTDAFNSLVESSAQEIHAYIVQCNDRQYGDSRIRSPHKDRWCRDIVRVRGGDADYCVVGTIDIQSLRAFQSSYISPDGPFKPVPDGFEISPSRKILPHIKKKAC